jgi:hypothetical protein
VEDRGVVLAAEALADVGKRVAGELPGEVHRDLAGKGDGLRAGLGAEVVRLDAEDLAHAALDVVGGDQALLGAPDVREDLVGEIETEIAAGEAAEGADPNERALELADVGLDLVRDEEGEVVGEREAVELGLLLQDGDAGFEVRRLDVGDEAPFEARAEALLDLGNLFRRAVARDDDLPVRLVEVVERVKELLLGALLARDELDVVDQQEIDGAIPVPEVGRLVVADGADQLVGELLGREVLDTELRVGASDLMADGVEEVRLAETDAAVDEERGPRRRGRRGCPRGRR